MVAVKVAGNITMLAGVLTTPKGAVQVGEYSFFGVGFSYAQHHFDTALPKGYARTVTHAAGQNYVNPVIC